MPLTKIEFQSGIVKDDTPLAAKGGWIDADKVRFRQGKPETIGGYQLVSAQTFTGLARGTKAWSDLTGSPQLAFGTASNLYAYSGGSITDITPPHDANTLYDLSPTISNISSTYTIIGTDTGSLIYIASGSFTLTLTAAATLGAAFTVYIRNYGSGTITLAPTSTDKINGTNASISIAAGSTILVTCDGTQFTTSTQLSVGPFSTVSGSTAVTVTQPSHGLTVGQTVTFSNVSNVGGVTISGAYTVVSLVDRNTYTITAGGSAGSTATGGGADYVATWLPGLIDGLGGLGYGTGAWGTGTYGQPSITSFLPTVWSLDNFGEVLLAVRRGGALYAWQPAITYPEITQNGSFASSNNWALGTNWSISGGTATASNASSIVSQNIVGAVKAGYTYRITFTVTRSSGYLKFRVNAGSPAAVIDVGSASAPILTSGTYTRLFTMPSTSVNMVFQGYAFSGTVTNVSLKLEKIAFKVQEAPEIIDNMFMDPNRFVVLLGTYNAAGIYDPLLARWSGQENFRSWVPSASTGTLTGELSVGRGGRLMAGLASRGQNLLWSDEAVYSMQYTGSSTTVFSIRLMGTGCGLISKNAATEHNGIAFWLSANGNFYIFQGAVPQVIDCRLRRDMFNNISKSQNEKIYAGVNAGFSEVWWFYPDGRDGTECSRYVAYNWIENHWTCGTFNRTAWVPGGIFPYPIAFGTDNYIYYHESGNSANGNSWSSYLYSSYFDIGDGDKYLGILRIVPDVENQSGNLNFYLYTKSEPNNYEIAGGPYVATTSTRYLCMRREGRQAKVELQMTALPMYWRLGTLRFDTIQTGARR